MIEIGEKPILWHIMKQYSFYGYNDFIICAGYKLQNVHCRHRTVLPMLLMKLDQLRNINIRNTVPILMEKVIRNV